MNFQAKKPVVATVLMLCVISEASTPLEVYPALTSEPSLEPEEFIPDRVDLKVSSVAIPKSSQEPAPKRKQTFETVPPEHVQSIAQRTLLIRKILILHRRAYDYRTHTTQELQGILQRLNTRNLEKTLLAE